MHTHSRGNFVYWFTAITTVVFALALAALIAAEVYVRWFLNQTFTFLGSNELLGLCILVLGLILGLIYSQKS